MLCLKRVYLLTTVLYSLAQPIWYLNPQEPQAPSRPKINLLHDHSINAQPRVIASPLRALPPSPSITHSIPHRLNVLELVEPVHIRRTNSSMNTPPAHKKFNINRRQQPRPRLQQHVRRLEQLQHRVVAVEPARRSSAPSENRVDDKRACSIASAAFHGGTRTELGREPEGEGRLLEMPERKRKVVRFLSLSLSSPAVHFAHAFPVLPLERL